MDVNSIADDIFEAAVAASQQESDGEEDLYGPFPKGIMLTPHKIAQQKRDREIRRVARALRELRNTREARRRRLKRQKQRPSPFEKLPSDLILKLMQHTHVQELPNLVKSSKTTHSIFKASESAIYRGIEIEQFPEWKWIFGDSVRRTPAQSQRLKDALSAEYCFGTAYSEREDIFVQHLRLIDNNKFTGVLNVNFLQEVQNLMDQDIKAIESYTSLRVARRTAMSLWIINSQRADIVEANAQFRDGDGDRITFSPITWEARSQLIIEQPASIQAEIRSVLNIVIEEFCHQLDTGLQQWTWRHYMTPGTHRKPKEIKTWMSKLVTGVILEAVVPQWYSDTVSLAFTSLDSFSDMASHLAGLLDENDRGKDVLPKVRDSIDFAKRIGLDVEGLVEGTLIGDYVDFAGLKSDHEA